MKQILGILSLTAMLVLAANRSDAAVLSPITIASPGPLVVHTGNLSVPDGPFDDYFRLYLGSDNLFDVTISATSTIIRDKDSNVTSGIPDLAIELSFPLGTQVAASPSPAGTDGTATITNFLLDQPSTALLCPNCYEIHVFGNAVNSGAYDLTVSASVVPVPGAFLLFGSGLAALGFAGRVGRRSQKKADATA